ncbi:TPA: DUF3042 family protein, partial [Enterococcus faecium]|nr:DUF3042 family protein [Enterococcus faecium]
MIEENRKKAMRKRVSR